MKRAFDRIDSMKQGRLGLKEVDRVLDDLSYTESEKNCVLDTLDFDGDGTVTHDNFFRACQSGTVCVTKNGNTEGVEILTDPGDMEIMYEFYRRLSAYMRVKRQKEKEVALLMGQRWIEDEELEEARAAKEALQNVRGPGMPVPGEVGLVDSTKGFDDIIAAAGDTPVIVKFFASWCRKCAALKPKYNNLARGYGERVIFIKMDVENKEARALIKERAGVNSIPTFQVWKEGQLRDQFVAGASIPAVPKALAEMIDKNLACGFSLVDEVAEVGESNKNTVANAAAVALDYEENKPLINQDAMAKFRAAQAAKMNTGRRNPFGK